MHFTHVGQVVHKDFESFRQVYERANYEPYQADCCLFWGIKVRVLLIHHA